MKIKKFFDKFKKKSCLDCNTCPHCYICKTAKVEQDSLVCRFKLGKKLL